MFQTLCPRGGKVFPQWPLIKEQTDGLESLVGSSKDGPSAFSQIDLAGAVDDITMKGSGFVEGVRVKQRLKEVSQPGVWIMIKISERAVTLPREVMEKDDSEEDATLGRQITTSRASLLSDWKLDEASIIEEYCVYVYIHIFVCVCF